MRDRGGVAIGLALGAGYFVLAWTRHQHHWTGAFDLGFFDQAVWQLSHGRTHSSLLGRSVFSDHLSPVLLLFAGAYKVAATPAWLLGAQSLCLGMTVLPMRALARDVGVDQRWATAMVVLSPPLLAAAFFDFHPGTLAVPLLGVAVVASQRDDPRWATLAGLGVVLCRADLGVALLGIAVVSRPAARRRLVAVGAIGAIAAAVVPGRMGNPGSWTAYYADLGSGPVDAVLHPWRIVDALVSGNVIALLLGWLLAVGFLPVFRPRWVLAVVVAALPFLLNSFPGPTLPWFHHGSVVVPILIGGALTVLGDPPAVLARSGAPIRRVAPAFCAAAALLTTSPLAPRAPGSINAYSALGERHDIEGATSLVESDEGVSASQLLVPLLAHRERLHVHPLPFEVPDTLYPRGLAPDRPEDATGVDVVLVDGGMPADVPAGFTLMEEIDGVAVLRRTDDR